MTSPRRALRVSFRVFLIEGLFTSVLCFCLCFCLCAPGLAMPLAELVPATTEDLLQMTEESLHTDWQENRAFVRGVGRVVQNTAQGRLLTRISWTTNIWRGSRSSQRRVLCIVVANHQSFFDAFCMGALPIYDLAFVVRAIRKTSNKEEGENVK